MLTPQLSTGWRPVPFTRLPVRPIFRGMDALKKLVETLSHTTDILEEARDLEITDLCDMGMELEDALLIHSLSHIYFGPTASEELQAETVAHARANRYTIHAFEFTEELVHQLENPAHAWRLRLQVCRLSPYREDFEDLGQLLLAGFNSLETLSTESLTPAAQQLRALNWWRAQRAHRDAGTLSGAGAGNLAP